jgi:hypothetical protein
LGIAKQNIADETKIQVTYNPVQVLANHASDDLGVINGHVAIETSQLLIQVELAILAA